MPFRPLNVSSDGMNSYTPPTPGFRPIGNIPSLTPTPAPSFQDYMKSMGDTVTRNAGNIKNSSIVSGLMQPAPQAKGFGEWLWDTSTAPIRQTAQGAGNVLGGLWDTGASAVSGNLEGAARGLGKLGTGTAQMLSAPLAPAINGMQGAMGATLNAAAPQVGKVIQGGQQMGNALLTSGRDTAGRIGDVFQGKNPFDRPYTKTSNDFLSGLSKVGSGAIGTAFSPMTGAASQLPLQAQQGLGLLGQGYESVRNFLPNVTGQSGTQTGETMGNLFDVGSMLLPGAVAAGAKRLGNTAFGKNIGQKVGNVAGQVADGYVQNIQPVVNKVKGQIQRPLDFTLNTVGDLPKNLPKIPGKAVEQGIQQYYGISKPTQKTLKAGNEYVKLSDQGKWNQQVFLDDTARDLNKRLENLSGTGKEYGKLRESGVKAQVPVDVTKEVLSRDYGLTVDSKGKIVYNPDTSRVVLGKPELLRLQEMYDKVKPSGTEVGINRFVNNRQTMDKVSRYEAGVDVGTLEKIAKRIRTEYDSYSPKELKAIDAKFAPEIKYLKEVKGNIFDKNGNVKPSAEGYLSNLGGANKTTQVRALQKLIPDLKAKIDAIAALKDLAQAETRYGGGSAGVKAAISGTIGGALGSVFGPAGSVAGGIAGAAASMPSLPISILKGIGNKKLGKLGK